MHGRTYSVAGHCVWLAAYVTLTTFTTAALCVAHDSDSPGAAGEKALKYHKLLVTRPEPGYLFDRFYNTWLDESTVDSLEAFLSKRAGDPGDTSDRLLLGFFYVKKGDDVSALEEFRKTLANNPASAATWYHKSVVEARTLDFDTAIADLKKAREQSPDEKLSVQIEKQLGKLLARNRQTAEALQVWQALLKAKPGDEELSEDLIELHIEEGLFKEAAALAEKLLERTQDKYLAVTRRLRMGDIHHRAGKRAEAIEVYVSALDAVGSETWLEREILAQIDQVYRREDDLTGLKRQYDELLKKFAKRLAIHRRHAQLLVELGEHDAAMNAFREILKLTPGERATREEYIAVLAKIDKKDEAIKELQALCEQHKEDAELRFRLASLRQEANQTDEAIAAVNDYLTTSDGSEYAHLRAARLLERFEDKAPATGVYETMAEKFADSSSAQEAYAAFLYTAGRKEDAVKRWRTLADAAEVGQALQIARALSARSEHEPALELLTSRFEEFKNDPLFLGQLVTTALALKKYEEAIPWAEERVRLSEVANELETAVDQAAIVIERADKLEEVARRMEAAEKRGVPETCLLAELLERLGDSNKADDVLRSVVDKDGLLALSQQIRLFSQRRDWAAAADATRRILELPGGRKSLHVRRLVELYQRDYQLEEGLKWVDEWKRLSPGSTTPWITEARLFQALGKTEEALKVLRTAVLRFEEDEDLRVRLAEFYGEIDKPADAQRIYWQLYEDTEDLNGKLRWAQKLAEIAQQQGSVRQLVEDFDERVRTNRQSIVPLLSLSEIYRATDDYEGRRRALTAAAKIKPDDMYLLQQIARVEEQDGDWQAAVATLERAAALDKTNRTREQIARLHLQYGEDEAGFAILFDLAGAADVDPRTVETTADTLCAMQEWERAAEFLQKHVVNHPADYRLRYLLAVTLEESGRTDDGREQFFQLLDDQEELPSKKSQAAGQASMMHSYYGYIQQLLPPDAFQWMQLSQYRYTAYQHRQQGLRGQMLSYSSSAGGAMRSMVQLPSSVDMVRPLALSHLISIAGTLEEEAQEELAKELSSHGVEHAKFLARFNPEHGDFTQVLPQILEEDPDNETALAMLVMQQSGMRDQTLGAHCEKALEKFRKSRPQLAFMAAVQAGMHEAINSAGDETSDDAESETDEAETGAEADAEKGEAKPAHKNKYLDEALEIAATIEQPNPMIVMSLTSALGGRNVGGVEVPLDDAYRQKLSRLLIDWYPEMSRSPQWGVWAFHQAVQSLAASDDPSAYVDFLDEEVARFQAGSGGQHARTLAAQMGYGRPGMQQLLTPLAFPPKQLAEFPPHVLMLFAMDANSNPYGFGIARSGAELEPERIKPLLEGVKSPILRLLLAHRAELTEIVDESIAKLLATKTPRIDAYMLAASRACEQEKHAEAVRLLQKSRYLPMNQEMRRQVDAAVVAAVLAAKDQKQDLDAELIEAGQQASLRLRRARLDAQQRGELITAMEDLGLKKEAKKFDELASTSSTNVSPAASGVYYGGRVAPVQADRISKLIEQGKRDAAVRQLANEVAGHARQVLSNPQNTRHYRYMFREVKQRAAAHSLTDDVLAALKPGESINVQRIAEYAIACQMFDQPDTARAGFEQILQLRPKDDAARMQLILLVGTKDPAAAGEHLKNLSKTTRGNFGQMIAEQLQDYEASLEERLGFGRIAIEYLKTLEPGEIAQAYWVENLMNSIGGHMHTNRGSGMPSLYAEKSARNESQYTVLKNQPELAKQRQAIHKDLCEQMLTMPDLARAGFRHLLAAAEANGDDLDSFAECAEQLLATEAEAKPLARTTEHHVYHYSSGGSQVRFRTPEEFLARRAWKANDWKLIDETLLPRFEGAKNKDTRERIEQLAALYRCEEAEFLERAEAVTKRSRITTQPGQANDGMAIAVDVWVDRELGVDLQPMILKQLKLEVAGQSHHQPPGYLVRLFEGAGERWDSDRQLALLEEVATIYVAPRAKRNDFIKKHYQRNNISWGTPNGRIYVYGQLIERLCQRSELLFTVLAHLEQYDGATPVNNLEHYVRATLGRMQGKDAKATMDILEHSPWLADLDEFRPLAIGGSEWEAPLGLLLRHNTRDEFKKELRALVAERQAAKPTFGGALILATLDQDKDIPAVLNFIGEQLEAIRALPEDRQLQLAALLKGLVRPDAYTQANLGEGAVAAKSWIEGSRASQSQALLARIEKAKRLEELGIQYGQVDQFLRENLQEMLSDGPSAVKAFDRLCVLARDAQRRGQWHYHFGDGATTEGHLLRNAVQNMQNPDGRFYNFIVDVLTSDRPTEIETDELSYVLQRIVDESMNRLRMQPDGKQRPHDEAIRALYVDLGSSVGDRPTSLLIATFYGHLSHQLSADACAKLLTWAKEEAVGGAHPELAADLHVALSLRAQERQIAGQKEFETAAVESRDACFTRLQHILGDNGLPRTWRLDVSGSLIDWRLESLPPELVRQMVAVYNESISGKVPILNQQHRQFIRAIDSLNDDPQAAELVAAWREQWAARYLKAGAVGRRVAGAYESLNEVRDSDALCRALELYLKAGDMERVNQLLRKYGDTIGHLPQTIAILTRAEQTDEAARQLRRGWPKLIVSWPNTPATRYNAQLAAMVPEVLEKLERDDERYFAEVLFASMPDPEKPKKDKDAEAVAETSDATRDAEHEQLPTRDERLGKLATRFASVEFEDPALKKATLVALASSEAVADQIAGAIAEAYQAKNILTAHQGNDATRLSQETRLATRYFRHQLREGKYDDYVDLLNRLNEQSTDDDYRFGQAASPFIDCCAEALQKEGEAWSDEGCREVAAALRGMLNGRDYVNINDFRRYNTLVASLHSQAGELDALNDWLKKVSEYSRSRVENEGIQEDIWRFGLHLNGGATGENVDARARYVSNVLRLAFERKWIQWNAQRPNRIRGMQDERFFRSLVKSGLLTADEFKAHGAKLTEGIGPANNKRYATASFAWWLQQGEDYAAAADVWRTIVKVRPKSKKVSEHQASYVAALATCLKTTGQLDDARATISLLDGKKVPAAYQGKVERLRRELNDPPAKPPAKSNGKENKVAEPAVPEDQSARVARPKPLAQGVVESRPTKATPFAGRSGRATLMKTPLFASDVSLAV